jgi:RNA polymerase sigma-70 factor (ECF subfamily)
VSEAAAHRDDGDLLARLQRGEEDAFEALIDQHDAALRRTALAFVSTRASAEEVVQDTWLAVLGGLPSFEGRSSLKTWIFQILINRAKTRRAREARTVPVSAMGDEAGDSAAPAEGFDAETPKKLLLRKELAGEIEAALLELPARQRTVVMLRDALGFTPQDVCHALAVNETNQRVLLHRARVRLRTNLGPRLGSRAPRIDDTGGPRLGSRAPRIDDTGGPRLGSRAPRDR